MTCLALRLGIDTAAPLAVALVLVVAGAGIVVPLLSSELLASVVGVALFGALIAGSGRLTSGTGFALVISIVVRAGAGAGVATARLPG